MMMYSAYAGNCLSCIDRTVEIFRLIAPTVPLQRVNLKIFYRYFENINSPE